MHMYTYIQTHTYMYVMTIAVCPSPPRNFSKSVPLHTMLNLIGDFSMIFFTIAQTKSLTPSFMEKISLSSTDLSSISFFNSLSALKPVSILETEFNVLDLNSNL